MTVAEFLDVFDTNNATIAIKQESDGKTSGVLTFFNVAGVSERLSPEVSGATVKSIDLVGSTAVDIMIENGEP